MRYLLLFAGFVCFSAQVLAGEPKVPNDVAQQWRQFQLALKKDDVTALVAMVKFPLLCNEFKGDIKTPKEFARQYKTIFPKESKHSFLSEQLHPQKWEGKTYYEAWVDVSKLPLRYIFKPIGGKLYLVEIDNVNE